MFKVIIARIFSSFTNSTKMALIVRNDLKMSKGKVAAQCSHASIMCYQKSITENPKTLRDWCFEGQPKIVLKVNSVEELEDIMSNANKTKTICQIVQDAGRTELSPGTFTVLGIGPDSTDKIDQLVKHLKLL